MSNLDEALERFLLVDFEYGGGLANHGPMAVEALEAIGHQALIPAFVDSYAPRLPLALPGRPLRLDELEGARGDPERRADWTVHFEALLAQGDWQPIALAAVRELLPGLAAAAGHGLLRTVHAMRALEREDNAIRRRELARGLAYWSSNFRRLPAEPESSGAIEPVALPADAPVDAFLAATCLAGARLYLAHPGARVASAHAVTIPAAMRWLAERLAAADARRGARFAVQAVAALHTEMGGTPVRETVDEDVRRTAESWDEIRYRAACSLEEHAVELAEVCWREDRRTPDPVFRLAAADAALRLEGNPNAAR